MSSRPVTVRPGYGFQFEASPDGMGEGFMVVPSPLEVGDLVLFKIGDEEVVAGVKVAIFRPLLVVEILDHDAVNGTLFLTPEDARFEWPKDRLFFRLTKESCVQSVTATFGNGVGQWRRR